MQVIDFSLRRRNVAASSSVGRDDRRLVLSIRGFLGAGDAMTGRKKEDQKRKTAGQEGKEWLIDAWASKRGSLRLEREIR